MGHGPISDASHHLRRYQCRHLRLRKQRAQSGSILVISAGAPASRLLMYHSIVRRSAREAIWQSGNLSPPPSPQGLGRFHFGPSLRSPFSDTRISWTNDLPNEAIKTSAPRRYPPTHGLCNGLLELVLVFGASASAGAFAEPAPLLMACLCLCLPITTPDLTALERGPCPTSTRARYVLSHCRVKGTLGISGQSLVQI